MAQMKYALPFALVVLVILFSTSHPISAHESSCGQKMQQQPASYGVGLVRMDRKLGVVDGVAEIFHGAEEAKDLGEAEEGLGKVAGHAKDGYDLASNGYDLAGKISAAVPSQMIPPMTLRLGGYVLCISLGLFLLY